MFVDTDDIDFGYDDISGTSDSYFAEAWDELNEFLSSPDGSTPPPPEPPEMLRFDYKNLGVPFGADFEITKKAYKKLIIKYHPDINSNNSDALHRATEKSKSLNISYQKIKAWELAKQG